MISYGILFQLGQDKHTLVHKRNTSGYTWRGCHHQLVCREKCDNSHVYFFFGCGRFPEHLFLIMFLGWFI